ncbi:hypothetical protein MMPV_001792 [Pyropia vietnamensis]
MGLGGTKRARRAREAALSASIADAAAEVDAEVRTVGFAINSATPSESLGAAGAADKGAPRAGGSGGQAAALRGVGATQPARPVSHCPHPAAGRGVGRAKATRPTSLAAAAVMDEGADGGAAARPRKAARVGGIGVGSRRVRRRDLSGRALATRIRSVTAVWDEEPPTSGGLPAPPSTSASERAAADVAAAESGVDVDWWRRPPKAFAAAPDAHPVLVRTRSKATVVAAARADALSVNPLRTAHQDALGEAVAAELVAADEDAAADTALSFSAAAAVPALSVVAGIGASAEAVAMDAAADAATADEDGDGPISINPAVVAAKKSRTVRNKEARRRVEEKAAARRAAVAAETELFRDLPTLVAQADAAASHTAAVVAREGGRMGRRVASRSQHLPRLGGRRLPRLATLTAAAVPLSTDLGAKGELRRLARPLVGQGLTDAYVRLQAGGLTEAAPTRRSKLGRALGST